MSTFPDEFALSARDAARLRRHGLRAGIMVRKSRSPLSLDNAGGYMVVDLATNALIAGSRFDLTGLGAATYISAPE